jgi:nicotinamide riboside kinase
MKICITGTHSTGKTTLINSYVEKFPTKKYHIINEKAREVIAKGYLLGKDATIDSYLFYINEQLSAEIESEESTYEILFSDRSIIDGAAHPKVNNQFKETQFPTFFIELFENILHFQKSFFDIYIYIPIEFPMQQDIVRPNDEHYRQEIDKEIKRLLDKHVVNYYTITGTIAERTNSLNEILRLHRQ